MASSPILAEWLNSLRNDLATSLSEANLNITIPNVQVSQGDILEANTLNSITNVILNAIDNNTYLNKIDWTEIPELVAIGELVTDDYQTSFNIIKDQISSVYANNSITVSNSNTAFSNFSKQNVGGFNQTPNTNNANTFVGGFNQEPNSNNSRVFQGGDGQRSNGNFSNVPNTNFSESYGNGNVGFTRNCATFTANSQGNSSIKSANNGKGFSASAFGTESNSGCSKTPAGGNSRSEGAAFSDSGSFSNFSNTFMGGFDQRTKSNDSKTVFGGFSQSTKTNFSESFTGGNGNTCNTFIYSFAVQDGQPVVTNSNLSAPSN